ncbi:RNA-binding domain-containing protein [Sodiomyces alkalinus F11]|uniref:RNA-binding domain-containing protein n=1 Tax=Sodiomyces alkalinus (strain CBS 110278 / VKM F-3762 / F11) TaxID=1314773 RepID=A0A3N2PL57_SODAK|nr:RNA-binding domain-containing protein [Sodiomyces alkalinus F11]ROT35263.1 RNA-binding domain-containing protein [Sodiomyces alkalinus F11]
MNDVLALTVSLRAIQSYRDEPRDLDSEWVHDRYEDDSRPRRSAPRRRRESPPEQNDPTSSKLKVENLHYDLTQKELEDLFSRVGPIVRFVLVYDRAGRSEGIAYVTYEYPEHARKAVREFDGANANGQPIRLTLIPDGRRSRASRNPFDTAVMPSRPLSERITFPDDRSRSLSPTRNQDVEEAASRGIDRYVPGPRSSRSPLPSRRRGGGGGGGGRRPGARREAAPAGRGNSRSGQRPRKTQEELDAEMADYFNGGGDNGAPAPAQTGAVSSDQTATDDIDMIE